MHIITFLNAHAEFNRINSQNEISKKFASHNMQDNEEQWDI